MEEALAETYGQLRGYGLGKEQLLKGIKFPLGTKYEVTIAQLGAEVRGVLLGPITVGGMVYNVFEGDRTEDYEQAQ